MVKDTAYRRPKNGEQDISEITSSYEERKELAKGDNGNRELVVSLPVQCQEEEALSLPLFAMICNRN